jgi:hypothetical protein
MFVPCTGRRILFAALALGLVLLPSVTWATTVVIPVPFSSWTQPLGTPIPSTSNVNSFSAAHSGTPALPPTAGATYFGKLDLMNNDLIIQSTNETDALAAYTLATDMARTGFNKPAGDWGGATGITSSLANIDFNNGLGATAIGVILNDDQSASNPDGSGQPLTSKWDGYSVN